jgi:hypothetical protein
MAQMITEDLVRLDADLGTDKHDVIRDPGYRGPETGYCGSGIRVGISRGLLANQGVVIDEHPGRRGIEFESAAGGHLVKQVAVKVDRPAEHGLGTIAVMSSVHAAILKDADVVFVYATSREIMRLAPHLETQMKNGARLVSISADFPEWEPQEFDTRELIFVYEMPPHKGGLATYLAQRS